MPLREPIHSLDQAEHPREIGLRHLAAKALVRVPDEAFDLRPQRLPARGGAVEDRTAVLRMGAAPHVLPPGEVQEKPAHGRALEAGLPGEVASAHLAPREKAREDVRMGV